MRAQPVAASLVVLVLSGCALGDSRETVDSGQRQPPAFEKPETRGCPREHWSGPWSACAEAEWVRKVARSAGFRVTEETLTALVVANAEARFYLWTTGHEVDDVLRVEAHWKNLATVAGTPVYGDDALWRWWGAQGFVFWVKEGPTEDDRLPPPEQLEGLIRASKEIAPPS
jgi:hypothetical protein